MQRACTEDFTFAVWTAIPSKLRSWPRTTAALSTFARNFLAARVVLDIVLSMYFDVSFSTTFHYRR
jgi:hypothetical protein